MNDTLKTTLSEIKVIWKNLNIDSILRIKSLLEKLAKNETVGQLLVTPTNDLLKEIELYRDDEYGFVLTLYSETQETYRVPHNHGNGWVIYAVVSGVVEMGNYFNIVKNSDLSELILKSADKLETGGCNIYYPGEIHDTKCVSEVAVILRFTSCDLKEEKRLGRMLYFIK